MSNFLSRFTAAQWREYYEAMVGLPPRDTVLFALEHGEADPDLPHVAADLGCGEGRDTIELLRRGWRVLALDGQEEAIRRLRARPDLPPDAEALLETGVVRFEEMALPPERFGLVNAGYALPFCPPTHFPALWESIRAALVSGGRFSGQLFGDRDGWAGDTRMTHHTRPEVEQLLSDWIVERFEEEERDGTTATGNPKHWHVFHISSRRIK